MTKHSDIDILRDAFHKVLNQLNIMSVRTGLSVAKITAKNIDTLSPEEMKALLLDAVESFKSVERKVHETAALLNDIKKIVYGALEIKKTEHVGEKNG